MTNLDVLKFVCYNLNLTVPPSLVGLTEVQRSLLGWVHERNIDICARRDWWFLQKTAMQAVKPAVSGSDVDVTSGNPPTFVINDGVTGTSGSALAQMLIGDPSDTGEHDVVDVTMSTTSTGSITPSEWYRGTVSEKAWRWVRGDYRLADDADRVEFVLMWSGADGVELWRSLKPESVEGIEAARTQRSDYLWANPPTKFCVRTHRGPWETLNSS